MPLPLSGLELLADNQKGLVGVRMWPNGGHIELLRQPVTDVRPGILIIHGSSIHSPRASPILQIPVALQ